jgi:hypothetical protein
MNPLMILVATAALGVEVGWEPLPGGGYEYTIQIEPELLKVLEQGNDEIFSEVPDGIDVRRYRVMVGVGKVRRETAPLAAAGAPATGAPAGRQAPTSQPAAQPALNQPAASQPAIAAPQAAASDPFGTPPSETLDPEAELDADLGQRPPTGGAATTPPAGTSAPTTTAPPAQDPYGTPPPLPTESPLPQTAPPAATAPAESAPAGPALDFGNSASTAPPAKAADTALAAAPSGLEPIPANPFAKQAPAETESKGRAETLVVAPPATADHDHVAKAPAELPNSGATAGSIKSVTFDEKPAGTSVERETGKPELAGQPVSRPWFPLIAAIVLLGCSIGGNVFLGWVAYDARNRYRNAIAKFRGATA